MLAGVLVLWDVDHTLVDAAGIGVRAFELGFQRVYGRPMAGMPAMAGRTDRAIARDVLRMNGLGGSGAALDAFRVAAEAALVELDGELRARGRALPGAAEALAELRRRSAAQTLLTGNVRAFAEAKVKAFGLDGYLDLDIGGYGWAHAVRSRLVEPARRAARERYGDGFAGRRTVLVGDTPRDVEAALVTGAGVVGVATGRYPMADLAGAGAHVVVPDLVSTADLIAAIQAAATT